MTPRKNEKKYHAELVDAVNGPLLGYGYKAQRGFIKGVPDVELKVPELPLVKMEIKHEVFKKIPKVIKVNLTELQRKRLRDMQKANLACGWAVFVTVDKQTWVVYSSDPGIQGVTTTTSLVNPSTIIIFLNENNAEFALWTKDTKLAVIAAMLRHMTQPQQY